MSPDLKDLLDDAATAALGTRSLDARALLERGRARRRRALVRGGVRALAAAAVIALLVVLAPLVRTPPPQPAEPSSGPLGLPRHLPLPTPWTPTVTQSPIERASMLLGLWDHGSDWGDREVTLVLSADGRGYRRLDVGDHLVALTTDGRYVVHAPSSETGDEVRPRAVLHVLRLADGTKRTIRLPDSGVSSGVDNLVLTPDGRTVYALGSDAIPGTTENGGADAITWKVDLTSDRVETVQIRPSVITRNGTLYADVGAQAGPGKLPPLPSYFDAVDRGGVPVSSPDGRRLALYKPEATESGPEVGFVLGAAGMPRTVIPYPSTRSLRPFARAWTREGILFTVGDELRVIDPGTRRESTVTTLDQPDDGEDADAYFGVGALAEDVIATGTRVDGPTEQAEPAWVVRLVRSPAGLRAWAQWAILFGAIAAGTGVWRGVRRLLRGLRRVRPATR